MADRSPHKDEEPLTLAKTAEYLLDECRMVLPGIQALFGFQLVAVFSQGFDAHLTPGDRRLHLIAIALVAIAVALIMAPAALNRQTTIHKVTGEFVRISSRLLLASMPPLALGICLDFYLIAKLIAGASLGIVLAPLLLGVFFLLWWILPRSKRIRRYLGRPEASLPD